MSGQERKKLEQQLGEIRDFIEANNNTKSTLLDQRAEIDKEKQRLSNELSLRRKYKDELEKRFETVNFLGSKAKTSISASDKWVDFLGREKAQLSSHFEGKPLGAGVDILEAKRK